MFDLVASPRLAVIYLYALQHQLSTAWSSVVGRRSSVFSRNQPGTDPRFP